MACDQNIVILHQSTQQNVNCKNAINKIHAYLQYRKLLFLNFSNFSNYTLFKLNSTILKDVFVPSIFRCPIIRCSKVIGTRGDPSKPYPDCCITPICDYPTFQTSSTYYRGNERFKMIKNK